VSASSSSDCVRGFCFACNAPVALVVPSGGDEQPLCSVCQSDFVERLDAAGGPAVAPAVPLADSSSSVHSSDFVAIDAASDSDPAQRRPLTLLSMLDDVVDALLVSPLNGLTHQPVAAAAKHFKPPPASAHFVASLRSISLSSADELAALSVSSCSVCMTDFECGDDAVVLDCQHPFHRDCVLPWLRSTSTCPTCRFQFPTDDAKFERRLKQR
jgi:hypothetical protein